MSVPIYGLDKELANKQASKYDPKREQEVREWIESLSGEKFSSPDFYSSLKDGVLLCKCVSCHSLSVDGWLMPRLGC